MKILTWERFRAARNFLSTAGRRLEWAQFRMLFEDGSPEDVVAQLADYQNVDGGFGHALEPDLRTPASSVLATTVGLRILHRARIGPEHEMVRGALCYLLDHYDEDLHAWPIVPPEDDGTPHAPWFDRGDDFAEGWNRFQANPRAEVTGYLWIWENIVPDSFLCRICEEAADWLATHRERLEMHEMLCYLRLVEHPVLPRERRRALLSDLQQAVNHVLERNPERWDGYCLRPLDVAPTPQSPLAEMVADLVPADLAFTVESQAEDGSWKPRWDWQGRHPDIWPVARREWSAILTLQALRRLHAWGRLETEEP